MGIRVKIKRPAKGEGISVVDLANQRNTLRVKGLIRISKFAPQNESVDTVVDPVLDEIQKIFDEASARMIEELGEALDMAMASTAWPSGKDIIDTFRLIASRKVSYNKDGFIDITYDVPYFGIVHFGGYIRPYGNEHAQKVYIPGRPWIEYTVEGRGPVPQFDFDGVYEKIINELAS